MTPYHLTLQSAVAGGSNPPAYASPPTEYLTSPAVDSFRVLLVIAVALVIGAVLVVRRARRGWLQRAIHQAERTSGQTREKIVADGLDRGEEEVDAIDEQIAAMRQTLPPEPALTPTADAEFKGHRAAVAALTVSFIDAVIQPVTFANAGVPLLYAVPLGVGIAVALGVAPARVFEFGFLTDENEQLVLDRVKMVTKGIGLVTGIAAGVWTFARFADASTAAYLMSADQVISFTIAEGLGVLGGMLSAEAHIWRRPGLRIAHRNAALRRLTRRETARARLLTGLARLRALAATALLVLAATGADAQIGSGDLYNGAVSAAGAPVFTTITSSGARGSAEAKVTATCRIFVDRTVSGNSSSRQEALRVVGDRLAEVFSLVDCTDIAVAKLPGRDTLFMSFAWATLPAAPDSTRICGASIGRRRGLMSGFRGFRDARDGECVRSLDTARRGFKAEVQQTVDEIRNQMDLTGAEPIPDRTGVLVAIDLCLRRGDSLCLIISDGLETAQPMRRISIPPGQHVLMIQYLPAEDFGGARSAGDAARAFCALVPAMHVIQYTSLSEPGLLQRTFVKQTPAGCAPDQP